MGTTYQWVFFAAASTIYRDGTTIPNALITQNTSTHRSESFRFFPSCLALRGSGCQNPNLTLLLQSSSLLHPPSSTVLPQLNFSLAVGFRLSIPTVIPSTDSSSSDKNKP